VLNVLKEPWKNGYSQMRDKWRGTRSPGRKIEWTWMFFFFFESFERMFAIKQQNWEIVNGEEGSIIHEGEAVFKFLC
jgi:hypothetical protein